MTDQDVLLSPARVVVDRAQNCPVVVLGNTGKTMADDSRAASSQQNQHFASDPDTPLVNVSYLPDEGKMGLPSKPYSMPVTRLDPYRFDLVDEIAADPLAVMEARTIAAFYDELDAGGLVERGDFPEELAEKASTAASGSLAGQLYEAGKL